jgi:lysyl-tRNA synthetase class 2
VSLNDYASIATDYIDEEKAKGLSYYLSTFAYYLAVLYAAVSSILLFSQATDIAMRGFSRSVITRAEHFVEIPVWHNSDVYPILFGLFFVVLTYELLIKKRAAIFILSSLVLAEGLADIIGRTNFMGGAVSVLLAGLFLLALPHLPGVPDPDRWRLFKRVALIAVPAIVLFGALGLFVGRRSYKLSRNPFTLAKDSILVATGRSTFAFHGWQDAYKFPLVIAFMLLCSCLLYLLFSPHKAKDGHTKEDEHVAREILGLFGGDSLAYFNTRGEKNYFFSGKDCFMAYKVVRGVAIMSGDPVGPEEKHEQALKEFLRFCTLSGWRASGIGLSERVAELLRPLGLKSLCFGEETVINLTSFSLEGRHVRKLRQSVNSMGRAGYTVEFMYNAGIPSHLRHQLLAISKEWRGNSPETGYSMGLGRLLSSDDPDCLLALAYDEGSNPVGFLYLVPMYPKEGYSLDITRTREDVPSALSDYIISRTALYLKDLGYGKMSLHFLAFSQHYREDSEEKRNRFWKAVAWFLNKHFPAVSSYRFDKKYDPEWIRRYIAYPSIFELARCGLSIVIAESALKITRPESHRARTITP